MSGCERRSAGGQTCTAAIGSTADSDRVEWSLDDDWACPAGESSSGLGEPEDEVGLAVDGGLRAVDVSGHAVGVGVRVGAADESNDGAVQVAHREHESVTEPVDEPAVAVDGGQPGPEQDGVVESALAQPVGEGVPGRGRVPRCPWCVERDRQGAAGEVVGDPGAGGALAVEGEREPMRLEEFRAADVVRQPASARYGTARSGDRLSAPCSRLGPVDARQRH